MENQNNQNGSSPPQGKKFLFISHEGLIHDLAWQVKKEGNEVRYYIHSKAERDVADGFVEKIDNWESLKDWADVIVFDDNGFGNIAEKLRKEGKAVIGGSSYGDKLELDRDYGQAEMKDAGLTTLPNWDFNSFESAIDFVKQTPDRYVVKPNGKAQSEKILSFVGQEEDGQDIVAILEHYRKGWGNKIKSFQIQKFVSGVEVAVGAFFNGVDFIRPVNVNFEHKKMFNDDIGPATGEMGCYDEETEVLTREGWKYFRELNYLHEICTLDPETRKIEFHRPSNIVVYDHHRELITYKNRSIDIAVTPNHNMLICSQADHKSGRSQLRFVRADALGAQCKIPRTGIWEGKEEVVFTLPSVEVMHYEGRRVVGNATCQVDIAMDDWLAFFGIWLADGYTTHSSGYRVGIAQKEGPKTRKIATLLKRLPFKFRRDKKEFYAEDKQLWSYLHSFGKAPEKFIPEFIKDLSPRQIAIFLKWFALGDGTNMRGGWRIFYTCSKSLADGVQELLLKIGRLGTIKKRHRPGKILILGHEACSDRLQYEVHERVQKTDSWLDQRDCQRVPYAGKVYCATVPNHVMYVRRNGHAYWCGNTSMFWTNDTAIFRNTLFKMKDKLAANNYVGYIDINCIVNARGIYPLEFTSRFGYPTINIQTEGVLSKWGEFFEAVGNKKPFNLRTKRGFQVGVVVAVPPFPFVDREAFEKYSGDAAIIFKKPMNEGIHPCDVKIVNGEWLLAGSSGYALVVTGSGPTMDDAQKEAYNRIKNILIPNMFYRTDIGSRWHRDGDLLQTWGYLQ